MVMLRGVSTGAGNIAWGSKFTSKESGVAPLLSPFGGLILSLDAVSRQALIARLRK